MSKKRRPREPHKQRRVTQSQESQLHRTEHGRPMGNARAMRTGDPPLTVCVPPWISNYVRRRPT